MASGLRMIKQELGPDALILSTKTIRNGKLGLLSKPMLEITAAVDTDFEPKKQAVKKMSAQSNETPKNNGKKKDSASSNYFFQVVDEPVEQLLDHLADSEQSLANETFREFPSQAKVNSSSSHESSTPVAKESAALESEVNELKNLVNNLAGQITELSKAETKPESTKTQKSQDYDKVDRFSSPSIGSTNIHADHLINLLLERGISMEVARTISGLIRESHTEAELRDPNLVSQKVSETIQNLIKVSPSPLKMTKQQNRIALVGPTGVGKTTTLAKIAASYLKTYSDSVALITIDTYRIAAVEQLKVYGEIMHLPVDVVITPEQLTKALDKHSDKDLILIDTAGRSPRDSFSISELSSFLVPEHNIKKHLVLSATTRENEIVETIRQFSSLKIANTIFTKIDECLTLGVLLNTQVQKSSPISYLTNGQRVPEDLLEISPRKIAELIMSQDQGSLHE